MAANEQRRRRARRAIAALTSEPAAASTMNGQPSTSGVGQIANPTACTISNPYDMAPAA